MIDLKIKHRQVRLILLGGRRVIPLFHFSRQVERIFITAAYVGAMSIMVFHAEATVLTERIEQKNNQIERLQMQIDELLALKQTLAVLEKKERELNDYFGLGEYPILESFGVGGANIENAQAGIRMAPETPETHRRAWNNDSAERIEQKINNLIARYETYNQLVVKKAEIERVTPSIVPVDIDHPRLTSPFGWRKNPLTHKRELHSGIDIVGPEGTRIVAPADGTIITRGYDRWLGTYMVLQHTDEIKTIYGHLKKALLPEGKTVKRGQAIAIMGNTGMSTSRHLHYTVIFKGRAINPMQFILDLDATS